MKQIFFTAIALLLFATAKSQVGLDFKILWKIELRYDSASQRYSVWGTPDTTKTIFPLSTSQLTIVVPDSISWFDINDINSVNFGPWGELDTSSSGTSGLFYHAISTLGSNANIYKNVPMQFFNFSIPQQCRNFIRLIRNKNEVEAFPSGSIVTSAPDVIDPLDLGRDFYNTMGNGLISGASPNYVNLIEAYDYNIHNYGWHCNAPLFTPLGKILGDIAVRQQECDCKIYFNSLDEEDVISYTIENSINGNDFTKLYIIMANGSASSYSYIHKNPTKGNNYYRVVANLKNATKEYSSAPRVNLICKGDYVVNLYPNPINNSFHFLLEGSLLDEGNEFTTTLMDVAGRVIETKNNRLLDGKLDVYFSDVNLQSGTYFLQYQNLENGYIGTMPVIKRK